LFFKSFSQTSDSDRHEIEKKKKISALVEKQIDSLKNALIKKKTNQVDLEFITDTFRIELTMNSYLEGEYNDFNMRDIALNAAHDYDSLLNKYYKKLLNKLKPKDRTVLIQAQKSWIIFRDNEIKLFETIDSDEYGGGGTAAAEEGASVYLDLIKKRTIDIFNYYKQVATGF
jgi:uncharacterized protein YecT (DUF1311 family)